MTNTDARLWHPWLRISRVLSVIRHTPPGRVLARIMREG
jgi:hypothetical protein